MDNAAASWGPGAMCIAARALAITASSSSTLCSRVNILFGQHPVSIYTEHSSSMHTHLKIIPYSAKQIGCGGASEDGLPNDIGKAYIGSIGQPTGTTGSVQVAVKVDW